MEYFDVLMQVSFSFKNYNFIHIFLYHPLCNNPFSLVFIKGDTLKLWAWSVKQTIVSGTIVQIPLPDFVGKEAEF